MVETKTLKNGKPNPKYVDLCDEDPPISGQNFVCLSFVSPENILKKREIYLFEKFVEQWDLSKSMEKFSEFLNFISFKYNLNVENVLTDYNEYIKEEDVKLKSDAKCIENDYKNFIDKNEERLNLHFNRENKFQTSVRGVKVRGSFATQEEAERNCKKLRDGDPTHDIFLGQVGKWLPHDPDAFKTGKVEYLEPELNRLHEEKIKNEILAKQEFDNRIKESKREAIRKNVELAQKSGNKLTQTIDAEGNLVGVNTMNFDDRIVADPEEQEAHLKQVIDNNKKPSG